MIGRDRQAARAVARSARSTDRSEERKPGLASGLRSIQIFLPAFAERTIIASPYTASEAVHQTCQADPRRTA